MRNFCVRPGIIARHGALDLFRVLREHYPNLVRLCVKNVRPDFIASEQEPSLTLVQIQLRKKSKEKIVQLIIIVLQECMRHWFVRQVLSRVKMSETYNLRKNVLLAEVANIAQLESFREIAFPVIFANRALGRPSQTI